MRGFIPRSAWSVGFALGLAFVAGATARGQSPGSDPNSLARYVPRDDVAIYLEFDGIDAHADAWRKTAARKILESTSAGGMIRDVFSQLFDKAKVPGGSKSFALLEHLGRSGFVVAAGGKNETQQPFYTVLALRGAFANKEMRPIVAQALAGLNAPDVKFQKVVRSGHGVYQGKTSGGQTMTWWVEETKKEDVVVVFPTPEAADLILATLDGKQASSVDHPLRAGLNTPANGFEPVAIGFVNPRMPGLKLYPQIGLDQATRIDLRWGFQDDALQTVVRVAAPSPRQGFLAFLEGSTFDKGSLPPLPDSLTGFTVASLDTKAVFDQILAAAGSVAPGSPERINAALDAFQGKGKLKLRDDILARLGPKMAFYALPARAGDTGNAPPAALGMMMMAAGMTQVPKAVAIFEVKDAVAFGKSLDELMVLVNREIKSGFTPPPPPRVGDAPPRPRGPAGPSPEFRLSPGTSKTYIFSVPPELSKTFPPSVRPSIRVGTSHVVIALSSEAAKDALEPKGTWAPPADLAAAFGSLPTKLKVLQVADDRATVATTLASLPAKIQILANSPAFRAIRNPGGPAMPGGTAPGAASPGGAAASPAAGRGAMSPASTEGTLSTGSDSSAPAPAPAPGSGSAPNGSTAPTQVASIVIQVAPGKLPSADTIKGMLFPSMMYLETQADEIRLITRVAFPDISGLSVAPTVSLMGTPGRAPGGMPAGAPGAPGAPAGAEPPAGAAPRNGGRGDR